MPSAGGRALSVERAQMWRHLPELARDVKPEGEQQCAGGGAAHSLLLVSGCHTCAPQPVRHHASMEGRGPSRGCLHRVLLLPFCWTGGRSFAATLATWWGRVSPRQPAAAAAAAAPAHLAAGLAAAARCMHSRRGRSVAAPGPVDEARPRTACRHRMARRRLRLASRWLEGEFCQR